MVHRVTCHQVMCDASNPTGRRRGEISVRGWFHEFNRGGNFGGKNLGPQNPKGLEVGGNQKMIQLVPGNLTASKKRGKKVTEVWGLDGSDVGNPFSFWE